MLSLVMRKSSPAAEFSWSSLCRVLPQTTSEVGKKKKKKLDKELGKAMAMREKAARKKSLAYHHSCGGTKESTSRY